MWNYCNCVYDSVVMLSFLEAKSPNHLKLNLYDSYDCGVEESVSENDVERDFAIVVREANNVLC